MQIVIPKKTSPFRAIIKKGSGVVMIPVNPISQIAVIYYEGNLYNSANLENYEERILTAAGRAYTRYPTIAMSGVLKENVNDFNVVGTCDENYCIKLFGSEKKIIDEWTKGN